MAYQKTFLQTSMEGPVKDRYNLVYLTFFYLSIGMLLPWNFFINVNGYWMYKFRTVNQTVGNDTGTSFLQTN